MLADRHLKLDAALGSYISQYGNEDSRKRAGRNSGYGSKTQCLGQKGSKHITLLGEIRSNPKATAIGDAAVVDQEEDM